MDPISGTVIGKNFKNHSLKWTRMSFAIIFEVLVSSIHNWHGTFKLLLESHSDFIVPIISFTRFSHPRDSCCLIIRFIPFPSYILCSIITRNVGRGSWTKYVPIWICFSCESTSFPFPSFFLSSIFSDDSSIPWWAAQVFLLCLSDLMQHFFFLHTLLWFKTVWLVEFLSFLTKQFLSSPCRNLFSPHHSILQPQNMFQSFSSGFRWRRNSSFPLLFKRVDQRNSILRKSVFSILFTFRFSSFHATGYRKGGPAGCSRQDYLYSLLMQPFEKWNKIDHKAWCNGSESYSDLGRTFFLGDRVNDGNHFEDLDSGGKMENSAQVFQNSLSCTREQAAASGIPAVLLSLLSSSPPFCVSVRNTVCSQFPPVSHLCLSLSPSFLLHTQFRSSRQSVSACVARTSSPLLFSIPIPLRSILVSPCSTSKNTRPVHFDLCTTIFFSSTSCIHPHLFSLSFRPSLSHFLMWDLLPLTLLLPSSSSPFQSMKLLTILTQSTLFK